MNPEGGRPADGDEEVLVVQRRFRRVPLVLLAALILVATAFLVVHETGKPSAGPTRPVSTAVAQAPTTPPLTQASTLTPRPPVAVLDLRRPLLPDAGDWELFGRGSGVVMRMQLADGRITMTTVPLLQSSGPVSFVVGADQAIIRPIDLVPGYVVPDGRPAQEISGSVGLSQGGPAFPGPDPDHVWAVSKDSNPSVLTLVGLDGARPGPVLPMPRGASPLEAIADGAGYVLFVGADGTYDSGPSGLHRITTGSVLAVGPTRWLVRECGAQGTCKLVVIDQATGARHVLRTPIARLDATAGVIAPNGTAAAFYFVSPSPALEIVDLQTGAQHVVPIRIDPATVDPRQSLVWSPESRWLIALDATGQVRAIDPRTRRITAFATPGLLLPSLSQIATR